MYIANADPSQSGQSLMGGVPLPTITLTDKTGASRQLDACSPVNKWLDLSDFVTFLFPPAFDPDINEGTPSSDRLWFASPKKLPSILWPNPDGKYMMMWPGDYQPGRIIVMHGKAGGPRHVQWIADLGACERLSDRRHALLGNVQRQLCVADFNC